MNFMLDRNVWELVQLFNRDRNPTILSRKYVNLRKNAFTFFRGTCHLFYHDLSKKPIRYLAPFVWICGDLHLENFGTYKGDDRQIYFGINDFDEGVLAPCTWDLTRLVTSIFVAAGSLGIDTVDAQELAKSYLSNYANALQTGRIRAIVADNAHGIVENLLVDLQQRNRLDLLAERTELINERRRLKFDDEKVLKIDRQNHDLVKQSINKWAQIQPDSDFFEILDIGFRLAGTGSLGLDRYLILVVGKGSPDRNYLLDFKQQPTSALQPYLTKVQPQWSNQAARVMKIQQLVQSAPPALAAAIELNNSSYFLRELQPTQDKITLKPGKFSLTQLDKLIDIMAQVTASAHLHGSGKSGAAIADDLMAFGDNLNWQQEVLTYGQEYAQQVERDYQDFCTKTNSR
jgi:uncharacterized protein (DUF2252 family)